MTKSIFSRVMWVGRATVFTVGLAVTLALMLGVATVALAAVPGDPFKLGKSNAINRLTALVGSTADAMLKVDNNGAGTALDLRVEPGKAPMKVNSDTQVANLNADRLDGNTAEDFYFYNEKVNDSDKLDGKDSTEFFSSSNIYLTGNTTTGPGGGSGNTVSAYCDLGDKVLSGGYLPFGAEDRITVDRPVPRIFDIPDRWEISFVDNGPASRFDVTAICADVPPLRP